SVERVPCPGGARRRERTRYDLAGTVGCQRGLAGKNGFACTWPAGSPIRPKCARQDGGATRTILLTKRHVITARPEHKRILSRECRSRRRKYPAALRRDGPIVADLGAVRILIDIPRRHQPGNGEFIGPRR